RVHRVRRIHHPARHGARRPHALGARQRDRRHRDRDGASARVQHGEQPAVAERRVGACHGGERGAYALLPWAEGARLGRCGLEPRVIDDLPRGNPRADLIWRLRCPAMPTTYLRPDWGAINVDLSRLERLFLEPFGAVHHIGSRGPAYPRDVADAMAWLR